VSPVDHTPDHSPEPDGETGPPTNQRPTNQRPINQHPTTQHPTPRPSASYRLLVAVSVGIGGALGALARVGLGEWLGAGAFDTRTLVVTLAINTLGALALGLLRRPHVATPEAAWYSGVSVGFLGAFTTWSAVMVQLALLEGAGSVLLAVFYLGATLILGLIAAWWGLRWGVARQGAHR
jgi:CrcB protein